MTLQWQIQKRTYKYDGLLKIKNIYFVQGIDLKMYENKTVGSQIVTHTQMETGDGPNKPNTINL